MFVKGYVGEISNDKFIGSDSVMVNINYIIAIKTTPIDGYYIASLDETNKYFAMDEETYQRITTSQLPLPYSTHND